MKKTITWICLFATAMGFMETAVVVYLRVLYYPAGFSFPLVIVPNNIAVVEFMRELATIIMLAGAGIIAGHNRLTRFAYFILSFAIWDLFYYVFLYVLLQWPQSLFTWDILFLIPVPWVGPVLAPCIVSLEMILFAGAIILYDKKYPAARITASQWLLLISGVVVMVISFTTDYIDQASQSNGSSWNIFSEKQLFEELKTYLPQTFCWWLFWLGNGICGLGVLGFLKGRRRQSLTK